MQREKLADKDRFQLVVPISFNLINAKVNESDTFSCHYSDDDSGVSKGSKISETDSKG